MSMLKGGTKFTIMSEIRRENVQGGKGGCKGVGLKIRKSPDQVK